MSKRNKYKLNVINKGWFKKGTSSWKKGTGEPLEGDKDCPVCHKVFHYKRSYYNDPPKTCSKECRYKSASITGTHHIFKKCIVCGKEFGLPPSVMNDHGRQDSRIYCSKKCKHSSAIRYPELAKKNARMLVMAMIAQGTLIQKPCEICGDLNTQAHHYKGYKPEDWAEVKWLCFKCHRNEHVRLRRTGESLLL